ncbi:MAG: hypothetical protein GWP58_13945 [Gammaproteobacteria bacterium]|jgi:hypothetical protein|nr:hypothetical protein [Gammaproteobacteria bacterium]
MASDERKQIALDAIRSRVELFQSAVTTTADQVRGLLSGTGDVEADQSVALGLFAQGRVNVDRFASFAPKSLRIDSAAEAPIRAAQEVLKSLLAQGDELFVLQIEEGKDLSLQISRRLASIGRAFAAAHVVDLAKRGKYSDDEHATLLEKYPFKRWTSSERALAPALVIELSGADFQPSVIVPFLDGNTKYLFNVDGIAPAAALSRVISPGVFVQQETGDAALEAFSDCEGVAVAALLPEDAVSFVHDPSAGETSHERFVSLQFPKEVRKRTIGGISPAQQAQDYALLESLSVLAVPTGDAASDPAGKLSAWLISQSDLSGSSA